MFRLFFLHLLFLPTFAFSQSMQGRIVRIIDGDDFLFETSDSTFQIHLYGIDAPEIGQVFSDQTIAHLEQYLWQDAKIWLKRDINQKCCSAWLVIKRKNINNDLVRHGYAWYNRPHTINAELARSEMYAARHRLGLWKSNQPIAPWDFLTGRLAKPEPVDGKVRVLICTDEKAKYYHKHYCPILDRCHDNVIVILREQAKQINMKPCKHCY
jgi:endonuclease YncB( thermonuclease family)